MFSGASSGILALRFGLQHFVLARALFHSHLGVRFEEGHLLLAVQVFGEVRHPDHADVGQGDGAGIAERVDDLECARRVRDSQPAIFLEGRCAHRLIDR